MQRIDTISRFSELRSEVARALCLRSVGQKFEAIEIAEDGVARVTYTDERRAALTLEAVAQAAGAALAEDFLAWRFTERDDEGAWLDSLLARVDEDRPRSVDVLATRGDFMTALVEGVAFARQNERLIDEGIGAVVGHGGRLSFAMFASRFRYGERDFVPPVDVTEMARRELKPHTKRVGAIDRAVKARTK